MLQSSTSLATEVANQTPCKHNVRTLSFRVCCCQEVILSRLDDKQTDDLQKKVQVSYLCLFNSTVAENKETEPCQNTWQPQRCVFLLSETSTLVCRRNDCLT